MPDPHPGQWETIPPLLDTQQSAVHSCVIYNHGANTWKVLYFDAWAREGPNNKVKSRIWNPQNNQITSQDIPDWPGPETDAPFLFCGGHSYLSNGNLLVAGGHRGVGGPKNDQFFGLPYTYVFNPANEQWIVPGTVQNPHKMADGRWYPTLTTLGAGQGVDKVIAMSGFKKDLVNGQSVVNKDPEIYHPNTGWSLMANPPQAIQPFNELYPGAHLIPFGANKGKIFYSMPMLQAYIFNPFFSGPPNGGYWSALGSARSTYRSDGNSVLLPLLPGATNAKVLIIGGGNPATKSAELMDVASASPSWTSISVPDMAEARRNANAVILPDDRVLVVGGNQSGGFQGAVFPAEIYDPVQNQWTVLPRMRLFRMYHSVAVLLPDARVWVGGTTFPHERDFEIYSPGYLFEGTRPQITSGPTNIGYNSQLNITTNIAIDTIRLIRFGVKTHSNDMDQRSIGLQIGQVQVNGGFTYSTTSPANADIAPPGWNMLFVLRAKSHSSSGLTAIPSIAKIVKLS